MAIESDQIMEAALEAFEPGFELSRDQPDTSALASDARQGEEKGPRSTTPPSRRALLSRVAAQPASGELLTWQREQLYE